MAERVDEIGFGGIKLIQEPSEFCYGVDAVILADFAAKCFLQKKTGIIVDLGAGTGIIPLILSAKTDAELLVGVELQEGSFDRAVRNAELNGLSERVRFFRGDVKNIAESDAELGFLRGKVDAVTTNPPYMPACGGLTNSNAAKTIARHETTASLEDFFACAEALLKPKGGLFMVHRPSRLADICCFARKYRLEPKELCFVSPNARKAPNIVLLHCVKDGGKELRLLDPLFVYNEDGSYTDALRDCYL